MIHLVHVHRCEGTCESGGFLQCVCTAASQNAHGIRDLSGDDLRHMRHLRLQMSRVAGSCDSDDGDIGELGWRLIIGDCDSCFVDRVAGDETARGDARDLDEAVLWVEVELEEVLALEGM